ncbi:hypothetical protein BN946_scf184979.g65 [Trametes cinnabarina]|uniref:Enoyl reductase (ER) domain-containing protein n=1 Tax=Pycnoporus cinnabarinus TaxID=5643 RepID=A0A060SJC3_PYCCI|nr:hypothetical protein BN946_scf184979.g65 [Trametes cinnabarina]
MTTPTQQKALFLQTKHGEFAVGTRPVPRPRAGQLLVRNEATALNPVDWKVQAYGIYIEKYPTVLGYEAAGVVEAVGEGVTAFKRGDRILYEGKSLSDDDDLATFQQYTLVSTDFAAKVSLPDSLTFEQGATIPLALTTGAVGLYHQKEGPVFTPPWVVGGRGKYAGTPIVVIGGASTVGSLAIQLARLSGFSPIITTASLKNTALLKGFGATHVLDRNLSAAALREEVAKIAGGPVLTVFDAIALPETQNAAFELLAPGGKLLLALPPSLDEAKAKDAQGRTAFHVFGPIQYPHNEEFGKRLFAEVTALLAAGDIKPLRVELVPGGLGGIVAGLDKLRNDQALGLLMPVELPILLHICPLNPTRLTTPAHQTALCLQKKRGEFAVKARQVPKPGPGELLVRNEAIGLNPVYWKIQAYGLFIEKYPAVLGMDAAGVVQAVGEGATTFKPGDRIFYQGVPSEDNDRSTFLQYTIVPGDFAAKLVDQSQLSSPPFLVPRRNTAFDLLAPGGKLLTVLPPSVDEKRVKDAQGRAIIDVHGPIQLPQNIEFGKVLFGKLTPLLQAGDLKPLCFELVPGGLDGIVAGLNQLKNGEIGGAKAVVRRQETA